MKRSTERILTTHAGSPPRPDGLAIALREIVDIVFKARHMAISSAAFNPRLDIDSTTNSSNISSWWRCAFANLASMVGRENVIAGADCGFATFAGFGQRYR